jgi:hypothetical protein
MSSIFRKAILQNKIGFHQIRQVKAVLLSPKKYQMGIYYSAHEESVMYNLNEHQEYVAIPIFEHTMKYVDITYTNESIFKDLSYIEDWNIIVKNEIPDELTNIDNTRLY